MATEVIKVVLIDDDEDDFLIIKGLLEEVMEPCYQLSWVDNFDRALEQIVTQAYDLCLLDYRLGRINGLELLKKIREKGCNLPVIVLTGQGTHEIDLEAMKLGADDYLNKNEVTPTLLERSIRYAIERRKMEDELFKEKERALVTLDSIGDAVITTDVAGRITHLNLVAEKTTGWRNVEVKNMPLFKAIQLIEEFSRELILNPVQRAVREDRIIKLPAPCLLLNREGEEFAVEGMASPIHNRENKTIGVVLVLHDVTEQRRLLREIAYQANHDHLTGLVNRVYFEERLQALIERTRLTNQEHAVFYFDLDQFRKVNDTCGHFAGDQILKQIATLLKQKHRKTDTIARLGGDEFGIILENCSAEEGCALADEMCRLIKDYRFSWEGKPISISVSVGVAIVNTKTVNFDKLMGAADQACCIAKEKGGNRYHLYQDDDFDLSRLHGEMKLLPLINRAFEDNRFCLYYQPIVPVDGQTPPSWFEILIRLFDERGDKLLPGRILPVVQRYNMMLEIDRWVLDRFFQYFQENESCLRGKPYTFNINLSGAALNDDYFLEYIEDLFAQYKVPPQQVCFELTETIAIANFNQALNFIQKLKAFGCRFALDDFGSGLSSFSYLKFLPFDYLKIDGNFVKNINENLIDQEMVKMINTVAHLMGIQTIAEFVEEQAVQEQLGVIGVDYMQGYWIAKPAPLEKLKL